MNNFPILRRGKGSTFYIFNQFTESRKGVSPVSFVLFLFIANLLRLSFPIRYASQNRALSVGGNVPIVRCQEKGRITLMLKKSIKSFSNDSMELESETDLQIIFIGPKCNCMNSCNL